MIKTLRFNILFFLIFSVIISVSTGLAERSTINWLHYELIPAYVSQGQYRELGIIDMAETYMKDRMPEYSHRVSVLSLDHIESELRKNSNVVCAGLLKTPDRDQNFELSVPYMITLPTSVAVCKSRLENFYPFCDSKGVLDFEHILTQSDLKVGIASGRRYGGIIDEILLKYKDHANIYIRKGENISEGLIKMLVSSRFDYSILYPFEVAYLEKAQSLRKKIVTISVKGMPLFSPVVAAAPKNEWGKKIIDEINNIVMPARNSPEFYSWAERWLDELSRDRFRDYAQNFFSTPQ